MIDRQNFDSAEHHLMKMYGLVCNLRESIDDEHRNHWGAKSKEIQEVSNRLCDLECDIQEAVHAICKYHVMCDKIDKEDAK